MVLLKEKTQRPGQRFTPSKTDGGKVIKFICLHKSSTSLYRLDMKSTYVPIEIHTNKIHRNVDHHARRRRKGAGLPRVRKGKGVSKKHLIQPEVY